MQQSEKLKKLIDSAVKDGWMEGDGGRGVWEMAKLHR